MQEASQAAELNAGVMMDKRTNPELLIETMKNEGRKLI
jgi:hypothetical protein